MNDSDQNGSDVDHALLTSAIAGIATLGVVVRPFRLPEYIWAVLGAVVLVASGLLPWRDALSAVDKGTDVYLFLVGMMLLAELARREGLFDWLAARAVRQARGSARRLFLIVYGVGTMVTILLSNDATAVVLTPAVAAATTAARVAPMPYLFACAFIANAASFVLPISNPANLVVFGAQMPPLGEWLARFTLPSVAAIIVTYVALRLTQRRALRAAIHQDPAFAPLPFGGACAAVGIVVTIVALLTTSALDKPLGLPTFVCGSLTTLAILLLSRQSPLPVLRGVAWGVLPLVAGLFVMAHGVEQAGALQPLVEWLRRAVATSPDQASFGAGVIVALASNLLNNLPTGLIAATVNQAAGAPAHVTAGLLIGVDLGPNLSITGSLATILWLIALRRTGATVTAWQFLKLGLLVMPPALLAALLTLKITSF